MGKKVDYLIIGGGIAGTTAAETIRAKNSSPSIMIITEEADRLYSRVLLPHYLRNENTLESLYLRTESSYQEKAIILLKNTKIAKVDTQNKVVVTDKGETVSFQKLLLASGGKVNKLILPGSNLPGVVYLRTLTDAQHVKEIIATNKEAVVIGGGFIGIDLAQSFIMNGLSTTAVIREKFFWEKVVGENSGKLLTQILTENGVKILNESTVTEFSGGEKLAGVKLENNTSVKTDIAGVGIGIRLDLDYLKASGLTIKQGVLANEFLETSAPDVWAAGDIAEFYDPILKKYHTLGNWSNSSAQGKTAGLNMSGEKTPFQTSSLYSINIFSHNFSFLGDHTGDENTEVIERGSLGDKKLSRLLLRGDVIVGASLINLPHDRNTINTLIRNRAKISVAKDKLEDLNFDLATLLTNS